MKRIIFLIYFFYGCFLAYGQEMYSVSAFSGDVQFKKVAKSSQWCPVKEEMKLFLGDSLFIPKGGYVRVELVRGHVSYSSFRPGKVSVLTLVNDAKNEKSRNISKGVNREIKTGKTQPMEYSMRVVGVGTRAVQSSDTIEMYADQLIWIGARVISMAQNPSIKGITYQRTLTESGEVEFEMENQTDKDYYMNVLHINKREKKLSLCYVITSQVKPNTCLVTPSGYKSCSLGVSFPNTADDVYVLVVFDKPYDSEALDNELYYRQITPNAKKIDAGIQYCW